MQPKNIDGIVAQYADLVARHNLGKPGEYSRWSFGENKDLSLNPYGVADAANILYTIGQFPTDPTERAGFVKTLQAMQDPQTGYFSEPTHHEFHCTAHCSAALELFDAKPLYKCSGMAPYTQKDALYSILENGIRWEEQPWRDSHIGAGLLPSLVNTDMVDLQWKNWYFDWMWEHTDPENGFIFGGKEKKAELFQYMASGFHYIFNHEAEHRPMRYPDKVIDSCITLMNEAIAGYPYPKGLPRYWGVILAIPGFLEVDVVYSATRAMRQTPHRFYECKDVLERFADKFIDMMEQFDYHNDTRVDDLHAMFGTLCCLAELQSALPGKILSSKPLRLVLDRRPFI